MGILNVYLQSLDTNKISKMFTVSGNQGDVWKLASVDILSLTKYKVCVDNFRYQFIIIYYRFYVCLCVM